MNFRMNRLLSRELSEQTSESETWDHRMPPAHLASPNLRRNALTCPSCEYSLRGLEGRLVTCPECGERCDINQLLAGQSPPPEVRLYTALGASSIPLALLAFVTPAMLTAFDTAWVIVSLLLILGWAALTARAVRRFGDRQAIQLVLLFHGILIGYLGAGAAVLFAASGLEMCINGETTRAIGAFALMLVTGGMFVVAFRLDRYILKQCRIQCDKKNSSPGDKQPDQRAEP